MAGEAAGQMDEFLKGLGAFSHTARQQCSHISRAVSQSLAKLSSGPDPACTHWMFCAGNEHQTILNYFNLLKLPDTVRQSRSAYLHGSYASNKENFAKISSWISRRQAGRSNLERTTSTDESSSISRKNVEDVGSNPSRSNAAIDIREADLYFTGKVCYEQVEFGKQKGVDVSDISLSEQTSSAAKSLPGKSLLQTNLNGEKYKDKLVVAGESTLLEKFGGPVSKEELGRASWTFLHTLAAQYPDKPTRQQQRDVKELMAILSRIYPCKQCADHFKEVLRSHPVKAGSRSELAQWMCRVHNIVNRSLGKTQFPCERVDARWGALDCEEAACDLHGQLGTRW
ncbi:hypothetical protein O6H91_02G146600 [Diphasiastrum complanatum]|uniref:Uncharacterized protein n=1 Tax=Diphasiastrum complanatum TaxID=34168 RepID=A0ACC2ELM9_DIPCM|nr:hypothetical protein O6H91_02G146600 [Diphasiastrum complanatum]